MCELKWEEHRGDTTRSELLSHARKFVPDAPPFKIGITNDPEQRKHGYSGEYAEMVVVHRSNSPAEIQYVERDLIDQFPESDNKAAGGEGRVSKPPYFLYIVRGRPKSAGPHRHNCGAGRTGEKRHDSGNEGIFSDPKVREFSRKVSEQRRKRQAHRRQQKEDAAEALRKLGTKFFEALKEGVETLSEWTVAPVAGPYTDEDTWTVVAEDAQDAVEQLIEWRGVSADRIECRTRGDVVFVSFRANGRYENYALDPT